MPGAHCWLSSRRAANHRRSVVSRRTDRRCEGWRFARYSTGSWGTISAATRTRPSCGASSAECKFLALNDARCVRSRGLEGDRQEVAMLFRDLLIGVTRFFRDDATFAELKAQRSFPCCSKESSANIALSGFGYLAARRAKRPIRSRSCCVSMRRGLRRTVVPANPDFRDRYRRGRQSPRLEVGRYPATSAGGRVGSERLEPAFSCVAWTAASHDQKGNSRTLHLLGA